MKVVIRVDPETGEAISAIIEDWEKLSPLIQPKIKPKKRSKKPLDEQSRKPS